ncbi:hypothetical protein H4R33_004672 [Dimargaris cristalligena]|nr:hypothetical protein H4R33_004672 [Dimargaris cristalligena]
MSDFSTLGAISDSVQPDQYIYFKNTSHAVLLAGAIPEPILALLKYSDGTVPPVTGCVHSATGYAAVASESHVYVWSYNQAGFHASRPTTPYYTFPIATSPLANRPRLALPPADRPPLLYLVARDPGVTSSTHDVGLLVAARDGQVRFWQHVAYGLSGSESYQSAALDLEAGDYVQRITPCEPVGYLVSTHHSRLFKITLYSDIGKPHITATALTKPMGMLHRVTSSLLGYVSHVVDEASQSLGLASEAPAVVATVAGAPAGYRQSRELFVLTRRHLQQWAVSRSFGDQFMFELNAYEPIVHAIAQRYQIDPAYMGQLRLQLRDFQLTPDGRWIVLASYLRDAASRHLASALKTHFAIFELQRVPAGNGAEVLQVVQVRSLRFALAESSCPRDLRLVLPQSEPPRLIAPVPVAGSESLPLVAAVVFPSTLVLTTLGGGTGFEEVLQLRESRLLDTAPELTLRANLKKATHRSLVSAIPWLVNERSVAQLSLLSMTGGVIDLYFNLSQLRQLTVSQPPDAVNQRSEVAPSAAERRLKQMQQVKGTLEQATFFGTAPANPIEFSVDRAAPDVLEDAALAISREITDSRSPFIPLMVELRQQLQERLMRLGTLAQYLHSCELTSKLSSRTRADLAWNAQKMAVATALWNYRNGLVTPSSSSARHPAVQLLADAVALVDPNTDTPAADPQINDSFALADMDDDHDGGDNELPADPLRRFFVQHVGQMDALLIALYQAFLNLRETSSQTESQGLYIYELNRLLMMAFQTTFFYRDDHRAVYQLDERPLDTEAWYATADVLSLLRSVYNLCRTQIEHLGRLYDGSKANESRTAAPGPNRKAGMAESEDYRDENEIYESPRALWSVLKNQLVYLGDLVLDVYQHRLTFHQAQASATHSPQALATLEDQYNPIREEIIYPLVDFGRVDAGFELAEKYRCYPILVDLIFQYESQILDSRLEHHVTEFGRPFAFALYDRYTSRREYYQLIAHGRLHPDILDQYLELHPELLTYTWLHNVNQERLPEAASQLLQIARQSGDENATTRTTLSLGKLAFLATVTLGQLDDPNIQDQVADYDDQLDVANIYHKLQEYCSTVLAEVDDRVPKKIDEKAVLVSDHMAPELATSGTYPTLHRHFFRLVRNILQNVALDTLDMVDVLTLREVVSPVPTSASNPDADNPPPSDDRSDFQLALEVLRRDLDISKDGLNYCLRAIWRRVLLRDDWAAIHAALDQTSDDELSATLQDTHLYRTLWYARSTDLPDDYFVCPRDATCNTKVGFLATRLEHNAAKLPLPPSGRGYTAKGLLADLEAESKQLLDRVKSCHITRHYGEILRLINTQLREMSLVDQSMDLEDDDTQLMDTDST